MNSLPLLYSFRRCPFAIRARMALLSSGIRVELREMKLNDLPAAMLQLSAKGTVPVLRLADGQVIDESLEVMRWSLAQSDPEGWLDSGDEAEHCIRRNDEDFKPLLDRYKYADHFPQMSQSEHRQQAEFFLRELDDRLQQQTYLGGQQFRMIDAAIMPFIRQFSGVESNWFEHCEYSALRKWLETILHSKEFAVVMQKYSFWKSGDEKVYFGESSIVRSCV